MANKKIFLLRVNTNECRYEVRVNDLRLLVGNDGYPAASEYPINHLLKKGTCTMQSELFPLSTEKQLKPSANCKLELFEQPATNISTSKNKLSLKKLQSDLFFTNGEVQTKLNGFYIIESDDMDPMWTDGELLNESKELLEDVFKFYRNLHSLFAKKDCNAIIEMIYQREKEFCIAYGLKFTERIEYMRNHFLSFMQNPEFTLWDFEPTNTILKLYGNRKLAALEFNNREAVIAYVDLKNSLTFYLPFYISKINNNWQISL